MMDRRSGRGDEEEDEEAEEDMVDEKKRALGGKERGIEVE